MDRDDLSIADTQSLINVVLFVLEEADNPKRAQLNSDVVALLYLADEILHRTRARPVIHPERPVTPPS